MTDALLDVGVGFCFAVPGSPITQVAECAARAIQGFEWSVNEKVAAECAIGLSAVGRRSAIMLKQNGLNVALDVLLNAALHSIGSALLVIVADDLDSSRSTALQDSRDLAEIMRLPLIEPTLDGDLSACVAAAVETSEAVSVPVVIRLTGPLPPGAGSVPDGRKRPRPAGVPGPMIDRAVAQELTKLGRVQRRRLTGRAELVSGIGRVAVSANRCTETHRLGVVAFGRAARLTSDEQCVLALRSADTSSDQIDDFLKRHERVLVLEEPLPHLERDVRRRAPAEARVHGRLSGHLPPEGPLTGALVAGAIEDLPGGWEGVEAKTFPSEGRHGPYHELFSAVSDLRRSGVFVSTDVGSSVNLCYPPYCATDVAICLGSAVAVASGAARAGWTSVAVIGDYGLLHSGLQGLIDLGHRRLPVVVVVLLNGVQDKTGGQPLLQGVSDRAAVEEAVRRLVEGVGPRVTVESWTTTAVTPQQTRERLTALLGRAPAVALVADGQGSPQPREPSRD
jgi:indolepyruvate ferredoxin oxidoreductase, alpha subunit